MEEANNSKKNNNNNNAKNKVDYIENEVTTKNKSSNDEIINKSNKVNNNNTLIETKGKGKNNIKKKKKQKNAQLQHDKTNVDNDLDKLQTNITSPNLITTTLREVTPCTPAANDPKNESQAINNDEETLPSDNNNLPINEAFNVSFETFQSTKPTIEDILLNDNETVDNSINTDLLNYCPLTPRLIVDVENENKNNDDDTVETSNIKRVDNDVMHDDHEQNLLVINETSNDEYDYNDDDYIEEADDGDNGLLVQFLDEANRIVSKNY